MKKPICLLLAVSLTISACGGRPANPVMVEQYGDDRRSCKALEMEMSNTQQEIQQLIPQTDKTGKNVALGVAGWFLIVPWFFMDLSQSEQIEVNALRQRYNHLAIIAEDKRCGFDVHQIPAFTKKDNDDKKTPDYPEPNGKR